MSLWLRLVTGLLLGAAIAMLGVWLSRDPGEVQIRWLGYGVRTSVAFLLLALPLLYLLLWLLDGVIRRFPARIRQLRDQRRRKDLREGLRALAEGRPAPARRLLQAASHLSEQRPAAQWAAAQAAEAANDPALADELLAALARHPDWREAAGAARARLLRRRGLLVDALDTAEAVHCPLALLERCKSQLAQGEAAAALPELGTLVSAAPIAKPALARLEQRLALAALAAAPDREALAARWHALNRTQQEDPAVVAALAARALVLGCGELALDPARRCLKRAPDDLLAARYGQLPHADLRAALKQVESWLAKAADSAGLKLGLATLCRRAHLWGKAREMLEPLLQRAPEPLQSLVWEELGHLADALGDARLARQGYANALRVLRAEPVEPLDPLALKLAKPAAALPSAQVETGPEARGAFGFPLPPGG